MINGPDISACISHLMPSKIIGNVPQHAGPPHSMYVILQALQTCCYKLELSKVRNSSLIENKVFSPREKHLGLNCVWPQISRSCCILINNMIEFRCNKLSRPGLLIWLGTWHLFKTFNNCFSRCQIFMCPTSQMKHLTCNACTVKRLLSANYSTCIALLHHCFSANSFNLTIRYLQLPLLS